MSNERYEELAMNYGIDVTQPADYYQTQRLLLVEIMEHLQRLDKMVYRDGMNDFKLVDIPGEINKIIDSLPDDGVEQFNNVQVMENEFKGSFAGEPLVSEGAVQMNEPARGHDMINNTCDAKQYSDQMVCHSCGLVWDMNDPEPPECNKIKPEVTVTNADDGSDALTIPEFLRSNPKICGNCKLHGKRDCPLDTLTTIPSWQHEACSEFERNPLSKAIEVQSTIDKDAGLTVDEHAVNKAKYTCGDCDYRYLIGLCPLIVNCVSPSDDSVICSEFKVKA